MVAPKLGKCSNVLCGREVKLPISGKRTCQVDIYDAFCFM